MRKNCLVRNAVSRFRFGYWATWMVACFAAGVWSACAEDASSTAALWKLDWNEKTGMNLRSLVDPVDDLTIASGSGAKGSGLTASSGGPSNPDTSEGFLDSIENVGAISLNKGAFLVSSEVGGKMNQTVPFTFEGWWWRTENPGDIWFVVFDTQEDGPSAGDRLILSLRLKDSKVKWVLYEQGHIWDTEFPGEVAPDATNGWHHIAFTHDPTGGDGRNRFEVFMDGISYGAITSATAITTANCNLKNGRVSIGGRKAGNNATQRFDYLRLSNRVLQPEEFLNAAGDGIPTQAQSTLAYWKLGYDSETGELNGRDSVGGNHLGYSAIYSTLGQEVRQVSTRSAFDGQPPNQTVVLPDGNKGSALNEGTGEYFAVDGMGPYLELTNDFTVEGWILPKRDVYDYTEVQYVWNTRGSAYGWALELRKESATDLRYFSIFAQEDNGDGTQKNLAGSARLSPSAAYHGEWMHIALTYRHEDGDAGQGVWRFYMDGTLAGSVTNSHVMAGTTRSQIFYLGGRHNNNLNFAGHFDCVRVSRAALEPAQFLNGTEASASTLALWPLNSDDGLYLDCRDVCGNFHIGQPYAASNRVTGSAENPGAMPNPDKTVGFLGDPATSVGSIDFSVNTKSYLASRKTALRTQTDGRHPFTWEGWFKRNAAVTGGWQLLFGSSTVNAVNGQTSTDITSGAMKINVTIRAGGYVLFAGDLNDVPFPLSSSADAADFGAWRHLALTYDPAEGKGTWEFFVDGESRGKLENLTQTPYIAAGQLLIGGRAWSANSFNGEVSHVRLSGRVLSPTEFLNHVPEAGEEPAEPETVAYWKLDQLSGGALDSGSQVESRYGFRTGGTAPTASAAQSIRRIPNPDTTDGFDGDSAVNTGSASYTGGGTLFIQNLGNRAEVLKPFTVEGWMNWTPSETAGFAMLCGTRFETSQKYGWSFGIKTDENGTARFAVSGRTARQPTLDFVNAEFPADLSGLGGGWHHLALAYTPFYGDTGQWTLYVDGVSAGSVANATFPTGGHGSHWFALGGRQNGADGFTGLLDSWRITNAALVPEQFLYYGYQGGFILMIR